MSRKSSKKRREKREGRSDQRILIKTTDRVAHEVTPTVFAERPIRLRSEDVFYRESSKVPLGGGCSATVNVDLGGGYMSHLNRPSPLPHRITKVSVVVESPGHAPVTLVGESYCNPQDAWNGLQARRTALLRALATDRDHRYLSRDDRTKMIGSVMPVWLADSAEAREERREVESLRSRLRQSRRDMRKANKERMKTAAQTATELVRRVVANLVNQGAGPQVAAILAQAQIAGVVEIPEGIETPQQIESIR